jgi:hypothetical protein
MAKQTKANISIGPTGAACYRNTLKFRVQEGAMVNDFEGDDPIDEAVDEQRQVDNELADEEYREKMVEAGFTEAEINRQLRDLRKGL